MIIEINLLFIIDLNGGPEFSDLISEFIRITKTSLGQVHLKFMISHFSKKKTTFFLPTPPLTALFSFRSCEESHSCE